MAPDDLAILTADIVGAHVSNNKVAICDIERLIHGVHASLAGLGIASQEAPQPKPAMVSARASIRPDYIVCMVCGEKLKMLRRHLRSAHNTSPEEYRRTYGLAWADPMAAPNYSDLRRDMAKAAGLGRKGSTGKARKALKGPRRSKPD
jgi:predicted transcriptional regulator